MKKNEYTKPVMEIIGFSSEDIITTSGVTIDPNPDVPGGSDEFE